jgi:GT2 family glycosyltransferase
MKTSEIDVIIVTRNRYKNLLKCVKSVCLNSIKPKVLLIIDSSDVNSGRAIQIIKSLCSSNGLKLSYNKINHMGIGYSRNIGIRNVYSKYFAFLDDDEYPPKNWLKNISEIFKNDNKLIVLAGPKIPLDKHNYWHNVWRNLMEYEFNYIGFVESFPSGNSIYKTDITKNLKLKYDERFKQCSEDQAFALELKRKNIKIYFHKKIRVKHDLRRNIQSFAKQWFYYGTNKFLFHKIYMGSGNMFQIEKLSRSIYNLSKTFPYLPKTLRIKFIPGIFLANFAFILGYIIAFIKYD